ncbi:hypothetical protein GYMLUDRAFT_218069 [Collybiopsis luxurians FD-317 M1]|nr:hypothetical protein GYMLUDRAFT_218069 [Collybiopsis luxurians FD-317 M1]
MNTFQPGGGSFHSFPQINRREKDKIKRSLGQISCAECRRLKLRCDKNIPCGSCVRRKCEFLCPTETVPGVSKGKRESSETATLCRNIEALQKRTRQLEEALAALQSTISSEPHPLLKDQPSPLADEVLERPNPHENDSEGTSSLDALGTLTLGELGNARYLGRSAGPERLFEQSPGAQNSVAKEEVNSSPSREIAKLVNSFPFISDGTWDVNQSMEILLSYLPERDQAWALGEIYLTQTYFKLSLVSKEELYDELLIPAYEYLAKDDTRPFFDGTASSATFPLPPTRLAVLFFCLAHGALADPQRPMFNLESEMYFNLGRASLALHPVFSSPDLACVQALGLAGLFQYTGGQSYNIESAWLFTTIAAKLAHTIGLHYESPRWGMDKKTLHRRRTIYWDIHSLDMVLSQGLGRPHSVTVAHGDTPFPDDDEKDRSIDGKGNPEPGFSRWRCSWFKEIVSPFHDLALSPRMPDYQKILELEKRVNEHPLPRKYDPVGLLSQSGASPNSFSKDADQKGGQEHTITAIKGHQLTQLREAVILYIHRAFFAQAMLQSPLNPSESVYAPSFLAAYRAASRIVYVNVQYFYNYSEILLRFWTLWTGILSAAIVLGMIVIRCPTSVFAEHAYAKLGLALDLFKVGATRSDRAKRGLSTLLQIHEKATEAYASVRSEQNSSKDISVVQEDAEALHTLEMYVGYTKLLIKNMKPNSNQGPNRGETQHTTGPQRNYRELDYTTTLTAELPPLSVPKPLPPYSPHYEQHSEHSYSAPALTQPPSRSQFTDENLRSTGQPIDQRLFPYVSPVSPTVPADIASAHDRSHPSGPSGATHHFGYSNSGIAYAAPYASSSHAQYPHTEDGRTWSSHSPSHQDPNVPLYSRYDGSSPSEDRGGGESGGSANQRLPISMPLTMSVGAMNAQWVEMMQDVGVYR